mmetsp:Transcript_14204/g.15535  ORF Transcript_14204/g.15535 Transcript_14204/m.15535 type:complete len:272 (+) Transcript_14204:254-1069(+)
MPSIMIRPHHHQRKQHFHSLLAHVVFLTLLLAVVLLPCVISVGATTVDAVDATTTTTIKVARVATKPKIPTTPKKVVHPYHPKANGVAVPLFSVANPNTTPLLLQQQQGRADNYYKPPRADDYKPVPTSVPTPMPVPVPTPRSPSRSKRSKSKKGKGKESSNNKVISKSMKKGETYYNPSHKSSTPPPTLNPIPPPTFNPTPPPTPKPLCDDSPSCTGDNCCSRPEPPPNAPATITLSPTFFPTVTFPPSSTFKPTTTFKPSVTPEPSSSF